MIKVCLKTDELSILLARRNLSQNKFARQIKLSSGYMAQLMNGDRLPSAQVRQRMQDLLDKKFDDLFYIMDEPKNNKLTLKEAIYLLLDMEEGEGKAKISCHIEVNQTNSGVKCNRIFEVEKKSNQRYRGYTLQDALTNAKIESNLSNYFDIFQIDLDSDQEFKEFTEMKLVA